MDETGKELRAICDQELARLHKLIESGKEIAWASCQIERIHKLLWSPPLMIPADFEPGSIKTWK